MERIEEGLVGSQQQPARAFSNLEPSRFVEEGLSRDGEVLSSETPYSREVAGRG